MDRVEFYRGMVGDNAFMNIAFSSIQTGTRTFKIYNSWLGKPEFMKLAITPYSACNRGSLSLGLGK